MKKNTEKANISIRKIIIIAFISIMLVSGLIIGTMVFRNWFAYADKGLTEIINRFDKDVYNVVDLYIKNYWSGTENDDLNNYMKMIVNDKNAFAIVADRNTGELIANSMNMDNYLNFQDGTKKPVRIYDMGYPALAAAYDSYLNTNTSSYKLKNIENKLYINVSEYKWEDLDWLIFTAIPVEQLTSTVKLNIIYTMSLSVLAFLIAIIVYFALTDKLLKPITYLIEAKEAFANGDLSQRAIVVRNDEIGMVAKAFNNMADTICELIYNLEDKVKERTLELENANEMMRDNRNQLRLILDSTAESIYGMDTEGNCTFCNKSSLETLGYSCYDELIGKNMHYQIHHTKKDGTSMPISECRIIRAIKEGTCFHADDEVFWRKDGSSFDVEYNVYPQFKDGEIVGAVVTFKDITVSKKIKEHIEYLNTHDPVTGVYNRTFFEEELKTIDNEENLPISIIYGDVNGLKLLNDIHGHAKGDELLKRTSQVLKRVCRADDIVARVGGDEFVILLANTEAKDANMIIQRIKNELDNEEIAGIKGSISLAVDTKTTPEQDIYSVLNNAETEMYKVKTLERKKVSSGMLKDIMDSLYGKSKRVKLHSTNVSRISEKIAIKMNLSETDVRKVADAGYYHDIGKITLDENTLKKKGNLNEKEIEEMERHPLIGYRVLNLFDETLDIAEAVLTHHERWDGTGYPKGLKGEEIPMFARIIAVAEVYDAMTNMVDGDGITHEEALEKIKAQSGIKYDPVVVASFVEMNQ